MIAESGCPTVTEQGCSASCSGYSPLLLKRLLRKTTGLVALLGHLRHSQLFICSKERRGAAQNIFRLTDLELNAQHFAYVPAQDSLHFSLQRCQADWTQLFLSISRQLYRLRVLWFNYCNLDTPTLLLLLPFIRNLKELCVGDNKIDDSGAVAISQHLHQLVQLNIVNNRVTDMGVFAIIVNIGGLQYLSTGGNLRTVQGLMQLNHLSTQVKTGLNR